MNDTELQDQFPWKISEYMEIILIIMYSIITITAIGGNGVVCYLVFAYKRMHTVPNYFIVNLAVSDLLLAVFCIPFTAAVNLKNYWPFPAVMCPVFQYIQVVTVVLSSYTLVAMSLDRYIVIVHPFLKRITPRKTVFVITAIWTVSLAIPLPIFLKSKLVYYSNTSGQCFEVWEDHSKKYTYSVVLMVLQYFGPLVILIFSYSKIGYNIWVKNFKSDEGNKRRLQLAAAKKKVTAMTSKRNQKSLRSVKSKTSITDTSAGTDVVFMTTNGYISFYDLDKNQALFERQMHFTAATQVEYLRSDGTLRVVSAGQIMFISPFTMKSSKIKHFSEPGLVAVRHDNKNHIHIRMTKDKIKVRNKSVPVANAFDMRSHAGGRFVIVVSGADSRMCITEITYSGSILSSNRIPATIPGTLSIKSRRVIYVCNRQGVLKVHKVGNVWKVFSIKQRRCLAIVRRSWQLWAVFDHPSHKRYLVKLDSELNVTKRFLLHLPKQHKGNMAIEIIKKPKKRRPHQ